MSSSTSSPAPDRTDNFVHLHVHTEYSMLDGAARLDDLFAEAVRMGMPAIAVTDHGNVFGAYDFWKKATAAGIKPIIGIEAYVAPGTSRFDRTRVRWAAGGEDDVSGGGAFTHMTLLAQNTAGMRQSQRCHRAGSSTAGYSFTSVPPASASPVSHGRRLHRASVTKAIIAASMCPLPANSHNGSGCQA